MADRKWTLVVMPHGSGASRVVQLSQTALKVGATLGVALVLVALVLGFTTVSRGVDIQRATVVEQENAVLADQLAQLQGRLVLLEDTLSASPGWCPHPAGPLGPDGPERPHPPRQPPRGLVHRGGRQPELP
jgi:hypothetical protein